MNTHYHLCRFGNISPNLIGHHAVLAASRSVGGSGCTPSYRNAVTKVPGSNPNRGRAPYSSPPPSNLLNIVQKSF